MPTHFCLTVRFLQPYSHGRSGDGEAEWPPSPLRVFQALVAAAAARWNERIRLEYATPALRWLERQPSPTIVAAPGDRSNVKYRLYVPDNVADKVARSWSAGREASIADYRSEKDVRPTHLLGDAVHYLFRVGESDPEFETHRNTLIHAAQSITHLGWGVDMVVGNATVLSEEDAAQLPGERWRPEKGASAGLRVPKKGTLDDLVSKHQAFLNRLAGDWFKPVAPLTVFRIVSYRRPTDTVSRPFVAFELRTPDFERFQPFDPTRHTCAVAGMVRNAVADLASQMQPFGWTDAEINTFVHGHTHDGERQAHGPDADRRFAYLPLPSIERRGSAAVVVTAIRRVLVVGPPGGEREVAWARVLSGRDLTPGDNRTPPAALRLIDRPAVALHSDPNMGPYVGTAATWSTVTPVVLPGFDDGEEDKAERLLHRAFEQAGISPELLRAASLEWRRVGFRAGVDLATRYHRPQPCRLPRFHVRVRWPVPIQGPLFVGAARYRGLGIFAAEGPS
jgi:CRISPR-associated protein Csb2